MLNSLRVCFSKMHILYFRLLSSWTYTVTLKTLPSLLMVYTVSCPPTCLQESAALIISLRLAHIKSIHNKVQLFSPFSENALFTNTSKILRLLFHGRMFRRIMKVYLVQDLNFADTLYPQVCNTLKTFAWEFYEYCITVKPIIRCKVVYQGNKLVFDLYYD